MSLWLTWLYFYFIWSLFRLFQWSGLCALLNPLWRRCNCNNMQRTNEMQTETNNGISNKWNNTEKMNRLNCNVPSKTNVKTKQINAMPSTDRPTHCRTGWRSYLQNSKIFCRERASTQNTRFNWLEKYTLLNQNDNFICRELLTAHHRNVDFLNSRFSNFSTSLKKTSNCAIAKPSR